MAIGPPESETCNPHYRLTQAQPRRARQPYPTGSRLYASSSRLHVSASALGVVPVYYTRSPDLAHGHGMRSPHRQCLLFRMVLEL